MIKGYFELLLLLTKDLNQYEFTCIHIINHTLFIKFLFKKISYIIFINYIY